MPLPSVAEIRMGLLRLSLSAKVFLAALALCAFAVLGMAPLTGVPLPFISYGGTNMIVLLAGMGLLLNVAATGGKAERAGRPKLEALEGGRDAADRDRRRRDGGARRARAGGR